MGTTINFLHQKMYQETVIVFLRQDVLLFPLLSKVTCMLLQ